MGGTGRGDQNPRAANPALADPIVAIERELPSLRTDLKLSGKPKCENLGGATGHAASRGLGEEACEP